MGIKGMQHIRMAAAKQSLSEIKQESESAIAVQTALMERWLTERFKMQNQPNDTPIVGCKKLVAR
jgi:hypothetical protein